MLDLLTVSFLGNRISDYLMAIATVVLGAIALKLIERLIIGRMKRWARRTSTPVDDDLVRLLDRFLAVGGFLGIFYISINGLRLHPILSQMVDVVFIIIITVLAVLCLGALVDYGIRFYATTQQPDNPGLERSLSALTPAVKVVLWAVGLVFLLDNFGLDISAIVAGLGIGGVAIALASQGVLQDLFSYFTILFDRPFDLGDFIIVGESVGTVEYIGIKTTRLRSIDGEQIIIANTDLTSSRIRNFKRMERRRAVFHLGVTYETGLGKLHDIPDMIRKVIEATDNVLFDRAHFSSYGDYSLNFEVVYIVTTGEYAAYMDAQQAINFAIKEMFDQHGIEFAYPAQVTYFGNGSASQQLAEAIAPQDIV